MTQEEQKERLINIIQDSVGGCARNWAEIIANGLLANKVTAHPVELGDTIYMIIERETTSFQFGSGQMQKVRNRHFFVNKSTVTKNNYFDVIEKFGKTVFLTKAEAEAALKEREGKNNG